MQKLYGSFWSTVLEEKRIKAVLFDMDDTLIDWSGQEIKGIEINQKHMGNIYLYLEERNFPLPPMDDFLLVFRDALIDCWTEAKKTWAGVAFAEVLQATFLELGLDLGNINLEHVMRAYDWQPIPGVIPYPDTLAVLQNLRQRDFKIGLITNAMQPMWMRDIELEAYGILPFLDARITSGDAGYMKPHPAIYRKVLDELGVAAETAVFVGDRPANDIAGANEVGMISIWLKPPHLDYDAEGVVPDYTITQLSDLLPILEQLEGKS